MPLGQRRKTLRPRSRWQLGRQRGELLRAADVDPAPAAIPVITPSPHSRARHDHASSAGAERESKLRERDDCYLRVPAKINLQLAVGPPLLTDTTTW